MFFVQLHNERTQVTVFVRIRKREMSKMIPKRLDASLLLEDPYIQNIKIPTVHAGRYTLTSAAYEPGELLEYDMPDFTKDPIIHRIGYFDERIAFPGIYEGVIPWMSVCPSEISSMRRHIRKARGRVLTLGLGLGYYQYMISLKSEVESIDVIECQPEIIELFREHLLPQFENKNKLRIIEADAFSYVGSLIGDEYDYCFADIWQNEIDGAWAYRKLRDSEERLSNIEFSYWIDDAIQWYLKQSEE